MSDLTSDKKKIQVEGVRTGSAASESLIQTIGGSINWAMDVLGQIFTGTTSSATITSNLSFPGNQVKAGGRNVVVNGANLSTGISIVAGSLDADANHLANLGFSTSFPAFGVLRITYTNPFSATPVFVNIGAPFAVVSEDNTQITLNTDVGDGATNNFTIRFIAIGLR